jgi:imidazolonepropionase-like amidohydrolase
MHVWSGPKADAVLRDEEQIAMRTVLLCGQLFSGSESVARKDQALVIEGDRITHIGPLAALPALTAGENVVDYRRYFVMPGLSDLHTHLSYGNARSEEEVDLYGSLEYRAIRSLAAAQRMLKAGFTALLDPACAGLVTPALRDALFVGLFQGPRVTAAGPALTSRQGLYDYFPSWIGVPPCSTGTLVTSRAEAIETIRRQTKDGVDVIKIAMDGIQGGNSGGLYAAFDQDETAAMVREAHRLGRKVVVHARGREGALYAARAGVDIIYHASRIDDDGIRAALGEGSSICPSLLLLVNNVQYARQDDQCYDWWPNIQRQELLDASRCLRRAYEAGVRFLSGSETGFGITPYGEWATRELLLMVNYVGIPADEALRMATSTNRVMLRDGDQFDGLVRGKLADILVFDGDPVADLSQLEEKARIVAVWKGGGLVSLPDLPADMPRHQMEASQGFWNRLYTRQSTGNTPALSPDEAVKGLPTAANLNFKESAA